MMRGFESLKKGLMKMFRIFYAAILGFWEDNCYTKASTLTFYTLQSIVPFLAAMLAIAKGFGFDEYLENVLTTTFAEQREILNYAIEIALSMLKFISSGEIVGMGVILLLWTNLNLVGYIELALNEIWRVKIPRSLFQKIKDFSFALVVFPLIFAASSSTTLYIKAQFHNISYFSTVNQYVVHEMKFLLPWLLSCILFGSLYFLIPNAKLRIGPRLIASLLAGTAFQLWQQIFINLQVYIFSYNVVYGAFALLPLFLIWLQFSWMIALAGAEISAQIENYKFYIKDLAYSDFTKITRCELALLILNECVSSFYTGKSPFTLTRLSEKLKVSQDVIEDVINTLEKKHVLVSFRNQKNETCYNPLHDPCRFKILTISNIIEHEQEKEIIVETSDLIKKIRETLAILHHTSEQSASNVPLCDFFRETKDVSPSNIRDRCMEELSN